MDIGDNVKVSANVTFITHDTIHMVNNLINELTIEEYKGCILIGNNVVIGSNTTILPNVKIGDNVIIGAGAVVTHDIEDDSVVVGVPAKKVGTYHELIEKRIKNNFKLDLDMLWKSFLNR